MASADWKREAVEHLISVYRSHPVLYNMRHPRYYNKGARSEAVAIILSEMQDVRPETTTQDILRKIQTLRTQFGQEIAKSRRGSKIGIDYKPTAWWFKGLSFLQQHIKHRSISPSAGDSDHSWKLEPDDPKSYNVSIVHNGSGDAEICTNEYDHSMDGTEYDTEIHYEIEPIDARNIKTVELKPVPATQLNSKQANGSDRKKLRSQATIEFQQESPPAAAPLASPSTFVELAPVRDPLAAGGGTVLGDLIVSNDRYKSLGIFVASQMLHIKDDYAFYETQMEVLSVINRGVLRQLAIDKEAAKEESRQGVKRPVE